MLILGVPGLQASLVDLQDVQPPQKVKNIDKVTLGYDILQGNPDSTDSSGSNMDPGFRQPVFRIVYEDHDNTTGDGNYYIPKGVFIDPISNCHLSFATTIIYGAESYSNSLRTIVKTDFGGWGASFKASTDYSYVEKHTSQQESVFTKSAALCEVFELTLRDYTPPPFSDDFLIGVSRLRGSYDPQQPKNPYSKFISVFGTHFVTSVRLGGKFGQQSEISSSNWTYLTHSTLNVEVSASASAFGVSAAASFMTETQKEMARNFSKYISSSAVYAVGGNIPPDGKETSWGINSINDAQIVSSELTVLSELLTPDFFPDDPLIEEKQGNLSLALADYCNQLMKLGKLKDCSSPVDPNRNRDSAFGGIYQVDECGTNSVVNWMTNSLNCPVGYESVLFSTVNCPSGNQCQGRQYYCFNSSAKAQFQGAYQLDERGSCHIPNYLSGVIPATCICPGKAYLFQQIWHPALGASKIYVCLANFVSGKSPIGGFFQGIDEMGSSGVINNPFTNAPSCPVGYKARQFGSTRLPGSGKPAYPNICILE